MFTLAVSNRKGGTAKTTTAVNLAAAFADQSQRCLLIDMDPQGHAALGLGMDCQADAGANGLLHDARQSVTALVQHSEVDNLDFIPPGTAQTETNAVKTERLQMILSRQQLRSKYDIVIIDTPPNAGISQTAALLAADAVVIPFMPTPLGQAGVSRILADIQQLSQQYQRRRPGFGLTPIMLDSRVRLDNRILADMIREYGMDKLLRGIRRNVTLAEAFEAGQPISHFAAHSRGAFDYHLLAEDIAARWPAILSASHKPASGKIVQRAPAAANTLSRLALATTSHRGIRLKDHCRSWNN